MITKDCWGKPEYRIGEFFVQWHDNRILKNEPWYVTDAYEIVDGCMMGWDLPPFESFIQACRYLKERRCSLI